MAFIYKFFATGRYLAVRLIWGGLVTCFVALLILLSGDLLYSSFSNTLRPWHTYKLKNEFSAKDDKANFTFKQYLAKEDALFAEVGELKKTKFDPKLDSAISRYRPAGSPLAEFSERDWNRTFLLEASPQRGVALVVHGLSDSPYSMRSTAQALVKAGITVYGLRVPGHGTIPAGLDQINYEDWSAAVDVAIREISSRRSGVPFYAFGYSTGAALLLRHVTASILSGSSEPLPRKLFLYSPALGLTPFARFANLQRLVTGFGVLQKARWSNVDFEIDPYKYQSFAKNGAAQLSAMLPIVYANLAELRERGLTNKLPAIISFQSVVDQTVHVADLLAKLYSVVSSSGNELVIFALNRTSGLETFLNFSPQELLETLKTISKGHFRLSIVKNATTDSVEVVERSSIPPAEEFEDRDLQLAWPPDIFSLSHVAVPFPPDDPLYGYNAVSNGVRLVNLGSMQMRGERGVLMISAADQLRLKSNPFHSYMIGKIMEHIEKDLSLPR